MPRNDRHKTMVKVRRSYSPHSPTSPLPKIRRTSISRYPNDGCITPERSRRAYARSPSIPFRTSYYLESPPRDEYRSSRELPPGPSYHILRVSYIHSEASDDTVKDAIYREYRDFGEFKISICYELNERVAYIRFRNPEDARDAKYTRPRIPIYDKLAHVDVVYERSERYLQHSEYDHYYTPSSISLDRHRSISQYDRVYKPSVELSTRDMSHEPLRPLQHGFIRTPVYHGRSQHVYQEPSQQYGLQVPSHHRSHSHGPRRDDIRKEKFPNYLHHILPEDDPLATRTLFAGNLPIDITEEELKKIFGKYGVIDDIDLKIPPPGNGNAFAFVKFHTLDMAVLCKVELSGKLIGKFECKIGYGKLIPTTRIWVGGLGSWTSSQLLEREFDRFGVIKKMDYRKGDNFAYISYDSIEAAEAAVEKMRGYPLGGPDKRLRIDFADVISDYNIDKPARLDLNDNFKSWPKYSSVHEPCSSGIEVSYGGRSFRGRSSRHGRRRGARGSYRMYRTDHSIDDPMWSNDRKSPKDDYATPSLQSTKRSLSKESCLDRSRSRSPRCKRENSDFDSGELRSSLLPASSTLNDLAQEATAVFEAALILKNSLFPIKLHLIDGNAEIIDTFMKDDDGKHILRINQRLRIVQSRIDDVSKRIKTSSAHAIFLGLAGSDSIITNGDANLQTRVLRNLILYFKQKEAAGVVSLINKDTEGTGVLYAFPSCSFSTELLKRSRPNLSEDSFKEDHLVIVVIIGGTS